MRTTLLVKFAYLFSIYLLSMLESAFVGLDESFTGADTSNTAPKTVNLYRRIPRIASSSSHSRKTQRAE
jgi:hypothetical protein